MFRKTILALVFSVLGCLGFSPAAHAATVGNIQAFYYCNSTLGGAVSTFQDGPIFVITNTSGTAITGGVFSLIGLDSFSVGTIAPGAAAIIIPGSRMTAVPMRLDLSSVSRDLSSTRATLVLTQIRRNSDFYGFARCGQCCLGHLHASDKCPCCSAPR
jgi:hypothetical protein